MSPVDTSSVDTSTVDTSPVDMSPVDTSPVDTSPVDTSTVDTSPVDMLPVDTSPVDMLPDPLCHLITAGTQVSPLFLTQDPLCHLIIAGTQVSPLFPSQDPLCHLITAGTQVSPLFLTQDPLCHLIIAGTQVSPLFLTQDPLCHLITAGTQVSPLFPTQDPLCHLITAGTQVSPLFLTQDPLSHRVIEKRRRDRMNNCLADLNRLIPPYYLKKGRGRVEKTEIIEMAIKYLKHLQQQQEYREIATTALTGAGGLPGGGEQVDKWTTGYQEAMAKTLQFLVEVEGLFSGDSLCVRLMSFLSKHCKKVVAREGYSTRKSAPSPASSSGYHANGSSSDNGNYSNCGSNDSNNCSPDNPSFCSKKPSSPDPKTAAGGVNGETAGRSNAILLPFSGSGCDATAAIGDNLPLGSGKISSKMSMSSKSSGTVSIYSGSSHTSGSNYRNDSGYFTAGSNGSESVAGNQESFQKTGKSLFSSSEEASVKQESSSTDGTEEYSNAGTQDEYRCGNGNSGYNSGDSGNNRNYNSGENGNNRNYSHGNNWNHGYPLGNTGTLTYGTNYGGNNYGNNFGYNGTNRSSGNNSYCGDTSSSDNSFAAVKREDKEARTKDSGAFGLSSRCSRSLATPRGQTARSLDLISPVPANVNFDILHGSGRRPRSAVEQGTREPISGNSSYQDHKLERTSASVPVSSATDAPEELTVERPTSEVPLRTIRQHSTAAAAGCKSVRNEYFSSDNGSNTSSSGGEDNPSRLYKFKSNMKHRFSVDLEHSSSSHPAKKLRRDSGSSSSNYDQYESIGRPVSNSNLCASSPKETNPPHKEHRDRTVHMDKFKVKEHSRPPSVNAGVMSRLPTSAQPDDSNRTPVPIFAFNQSGSFYVPMSVDPSVVASAMSVKPEISPVLHPISIYVNFTPTCIGTSITMSPIPSTPSVVRPAFAEHALPKPNYSSLACSSDSSSEEVKSMLRSEPKPEPVATLPITSRGSPEAHPSSVCGNPLKESLEDKVHVLNYSEMTRPQLKTGRNMSRISMAKSLQDMARENINDASRGHHTVPEQRQAMEVSPQLNKVRNMRDLTSYPSSHQMAAHLGSHTASMALPLHATLATAMPTTHTTTNLHARTPAHLPPISVFSAPAQTLPLRIPHQLQHSASHPSSRMVREARTHRELPTPPTTVRDYFEPSTYAAAAGYQRGTLPWPYHLPTRPFKV
ncbi:Orange domain [Trinorchestia longiramus]|nr:Orange domain [Trinorchestia longiramus]